MSFILYIAFFLSYYMISRVIMLQRVRSVRDKYMVNMIHDLFMLPLAGDVIYFFWELYNLCEFLRSFIFGD